MPRPQSTPTPATVTKLSPDSVKVTYQRAASEVIYTPEKIDILIQRMEEQKVRHAQYVDARIAELLAIKAQIAGGKP